MQNDHYFTDRIVNFIEKWGLIFLILLLYFYLSYQIVDVIIHPDFSHRECGTASFSIIIMQLFLTGMATFILGMNLWFGKGYRTKDKLLVLSLLMLPLLLSFALFELAVYQ